MNHLKFATRSAKINRKFNALITETFDLADKQCQEHLRRGHEPFTFIVKDNFAIEDLPMTCASKMLAEYKAPYTATVVDRLIQKGGCLIGKANLDEFAMGSSNLNSYFKPVRNSYTQLRDMHNNFYVAGGSSGGCAVAIALKMADVAIGSDTGGSARNPASYNGIVGFKPSFGLVSRYGLVPLANSFDAPSFFTRKPAICLKYFEYTLGRDPNDCTSLDAPEPQKDDKLTVNDLHRIKIGIPREFIQADQSEDCKNIWKDAVTVLKQNGAKIELISLPHTKYTVECYYILNEIDVFSNMARYDGLRFGHVIHGSDSFEQQMMESRTDGFNSVVKRRIMAGNYFCLEENKEKYSIQVAKIRRLIYRDFEHVFKDQKFDAILIPSTNHSAPRVNDVRSKTFEKTRRDDLFTISANMCGLPAISVPFGTCSDNMPLGMQFICPYLADRKCIALGDILYKLGSASR